MDPTKSALDALIAEAQHRPLSRISFLRRAVALGLSATAAAGLLAEIEGPARADAAAPAPAQITFSSWGSLDEQTTITAVLTAFQKATPSVQVQPILTSWAQYWPKYNADLAAKSTADVQFITFVPQYAKAGALTEIRSLLAKHGKTVPPAYTAGLLGGFEYNGGLYGLPRDNDTKVVFYNKALFRKAGVPFPTSSWTYDDLRATAIKLTKRQGSRVAQYGYAFETPYWYLFTWQAGGTLFDNDLKPTKVLFNTPATAQAIQFMADLINVDKVTPAPSQMGDSSIIGPLFASGQLAMVWGNHALVPTFKKTAGLDWDVVGLPHFTGQKVVNVAGGAGYGISKWTTNVDASYKLWSFMVGPVASLLFASGDDLVPDNPEALKSNAWLSKPYNKVFSQQTVLGHPVPNFADWWPTHSKIVPIFDKVWIGEMTAAQAVPQAAATAAASIKGTK
jgi:multiple sugar transport system substrate-binding protein